MKETMSPTQGRIVREFRRDWPSDKEIGCRLGLSEGSVRTHMLLIRRKLHLATRVHLAVHLTEHGGEL